MLQRFPIPMTTHFCILILIPIITLFLSHIPLVVARDCQRSWRRPWRDLSCAEQDEFLSALTSMKESGLYDEFVYLHNLYGRFTHGTPEFLPWHRWYVWQFEKALQDQTNSCIYIPYWDWERDAEWESDADVWHEDTFGRWGATTRIDGLNCVDEGIASVRDTPFQWSYGMTGAESCLERIFLSRFSFPGEARILATIVNFEQYANTAPTASDVNGFRTEFELGPHALIHAIIGGQMETNYSPADPIFWVHHSNIDRLWTMWQDYWGHDDYETDVYSVPRHYEGINLDVRMPFRSREVSWDFQMEYEDGSRGYPTARDVMSNLGPYMHVTYMNDHLASLLEFDANPQIFQLAVDDVDVRCDRDEWRKRKLNQDTHVNETYILHMLARNSLRGDVDREFLQEGADQRPASCRHNSLFTLQEDREEWHRLCMELPYDTPMAERLSLLAQRNCDRLGNPRSDDIQLMSTMKMEMGGPEAAFQCFHKPGPFI